MRQLVYLSSARDDLADVLRHIASESGDVSVGRAFAKTLTDRCTALAALPGTLGTARPELREDIRSVPHRGFVIFFRYQDDRLEVVNVLNGARDIEAYYED